jgi:hypothetical protein
MQFEAAEQPTSYVKTTTTSVTRDDDSMTYTQDHYNAVSLQTKFMRPLVTDLIDVPRLFSVSDGDADDSVAIQITAGEEVACRVRAGAANIGTGGEQIFGAATPPDGTLQYVSCSSQVDEHYACSSTACKAADTSVAYPTSGFTVIDLGNLNSQFGGPIFINYAKIYPQARVDGVPGAP